MIHIVVRPDYVFHLVSMLPNSSHLSFLFLDPPPLFRANDSMSEGENLVYYNRFLTNVTFRGFHPVQETTVGFNAPIPILPSIPSPYQTDRIHPIQLPTTFSFKVDLSMVYCYDTADMFLLGDELVTLPFVTRVHRVDSELEWYEIYEGLLEDRVPDRYEDRTDSGPMSSRGFQKMLKRFGVREVEDDLSRMIWMHEGQSVEVFEKGTRLAVPMDWRPRRHFIRSSAGISRTKS